jgi:hypothetical protein
MAAITRSSSVTDLLQYLGDPAGTIEAEWFLNLCWTGRNAMRPSCVIVAVLAAAAVLGDLPCHAAEVRPGVEFYLLKDEGLNFETARKMPLADLVLQDKPWIAAEDILRYDWSSHCIYLKKDTPIGWKRIDLRGTPFVVVADGQRCYLGALWALGSSFLPLGNVPMIQSVGMSGQKDLLALDLMSALEKGQRRVDVRADLLVAKALRRQGQFHAGLQGSLDKVSVDYKKDTCSVVYTYTLRNADEEDLYVLDPEKLDPAFFHDFQNGVRWRELDDHVTFGWPNPRTGAPQPTPWAKLDVAWFSRLKRGESMTRTVSMNQLPRIVPGKYECTFSFGSPNFGHGFTGFINKAERQLEDGRIWLGRITATLAVELSER